MDTPGARLRAIRERNGFEFAKDAAQAMNVPIATYAQHEKAETHLPSRRAQEYAAFFGVSPEYLLYGRGETPERVPVIDGCGADTGQTVGLPMAASGVTCALAVPELRGFLALYDHPQTTKIAPNCAGRVCVVNVNDKYMVCHVRAGSARGLYHLVPVMGGEPLFDHEVVWVAPVIALLPQVNT